MSLNIAYFISAYIIMKYNIDGGKVIGTRWYLHLYLLLYIKCMTYTMKIHIWLNDVIKDINNL